MCSIMQVRVRRLSRRDDTSIADCRRLTFATTLLPAACSSARHKNALLRDWTVSPIVNLRSGVPFNLFLGASVNGDANTTDRPFFAPRNSGQGPNYFNANMRVSRLVRFTERVGVDFTVDVTNLFNHVNYQRVNDVIGVATSAAAWSIRRQRRSDACADGSAWFHGSVSRAAVSVWREAQILI